jgi:DNA polymerase-3 subunit gamma/tau
VGLALYRKYRPATFADVVGQEHVTEPLRIALSAGRVNHAYLFSGPRGCGKTSSARILARSLNCELGPTPDPCGVCPSCVGLAPEGPGSIDVIELDAASHGGVDDARELRDRAFYAPAESRYRVFIVDEAHMVTTQGFNALLKIVEEPPEHLVFVFATTEPDKVLATIRSRTHHYPFRLIPPGTMRGLLERICASEHVTVAPAVLPLVIRAGGGSARDTQSVLDQLVAGAGPEGVTYERAVALLGVTDVGLIDDTVDALAAGDGAAVFEAVDRLVEAGHDPRRFAADLLDRLRDLILIDAVPDAAARGLVDAPGDELERMAGQAQRLGAATLSRYAEIVHTGLTEMRGATAPRLLLELLCARMLLPAASTGDTALLQRLERMERRADIAAEPRPASGTAVSSVDGSSGSGAAGSGGAGSAAPRTGADSSGSGASAGPAASAGSTGEAAPVGAGAGSGGARTFRRPSRAAAEQTDPAHPTPAPTPSAAEPAASAGGEPDPARGGSAEPHRSVSDQRHLGTDRPPARPAAESVETTAPPAAPDRSGGPRSSDTPEGARPGGGADIDAAAVRRSWPGILERAKQGSRSTGALLMNATVRAVDGDTLVLAIAAAPLARRLSEQRNTDVISAALREELGVAWRVRCEHDGDGPPAGATGPGPSVAGGAARRPPAAPGNRGRREPSPNDPPPPPEPPDEEEMMAEADAEVAEPAGRRDPEEVAIELLASQLGARAVSDPRR